MHASQEKLWYAWTQKRKKAKREYLIISSLFQSHQNDWGESAWQGHPHFTGGIHQLKIICLQYVPCNCYKVNLPSLMRFLFRISRRSTSLQDRTKSLKISRMTSRYSKRRLHRWTFKVIFDQPKQSDKFWTAGKAEWDCDPDWCCYWCWGAGPDHGWRWKGNQLGLAERHKEMNAQKTIESWLRNIEF